MNRYTGDNHFGHRNIVELSNRPFASVEEMDAEMVRRWNENVKHNDNVYIVGDMFFRCDYVEDILKQLKGKKHLIIGNHDSSWLNTIDVSRYFESIDEYCYTSENGIGLFLCHRPQLSYKHDKRARNYMIHGHIHNDTDLDYWPVLCKRERILNAGVDINDFRPVSFEELVENNSIFKQNNMR